MESKVILKEEIYETDYSSTNIHIFLNNGKSVKLNIDCGLSSGYFLDFMSYLPSSINDSLNKALKLKTNDYRWSILFYKISNIFERYTRELADQNTFLHIEYDLNTELKEYDFKLTFSSIVIKEKALSSIECKVVV